MKTALIVEDDPSMAHLLSYHLKNQGYTSRHTPLAREGLALGKSGKFDLIILDLILPDGDGIEICKQLRRIQLRTPILMVTARSEEIDVVLGLEFGADDYITKPFRTREFEARIKAIGRRHYRMDTPFNGMDSSALRFQGLEINRINRTIRSAGNDVNLTPREFELLVLLSSHPGRAFSRSQLIDLVWGFQYQGFEHTVNSLVNRLRAKIEPNPTDPSFILTVWGMGYKFNELIPALDNKLPQR